MTANLGGVKLGLDGEEEEAEASSAAAALTGLFPAVPWGNKA